MYYQKRFVLKRKHKNTFQLVSSQHVFVIVTQTYLFCGVPDKLPGGGALAKDKAGP